MRIIPTRKPKLSPHRGRSWVGIRVKIGNNNYEGWVDMTWGKYIYFNKDGKHFKVSIIDLLEDPVNKDWVEKGEVILR